MHKRRRRIITALAGIAVIGVIGGVSAAAATSSSRPHVNIEHPAGTKSVDIVGTVDGTPRQYLPTFSSPEHPGQQVDRIPGTTQVQIIGTYLSNQQSHGRHGSHSAPQCWALIAPFDSQNPDKAPGGWADANRIHANQNLCDPQAQPAVTGRSHPAKGDPRSARRSPDPRTAPPATSYTGSDTAAPSADIYPVEGIDGQIFSDVYSDGYGHCALAYEGVGSSNVKDCVPAGAHVTINAVAPNGPEVSGHGRSSTCWVHIQGISRNQQGGWMSDNDVDTRGNTCQQANVSQQLNASQQPANASQRHGRHR